VDRAEARERISRFMAVKQTYRSHAEVMRFFDGMELVKPGLVLAHEWRPDSAAPAAIPSALWAGWPASPNRRQGLPSRAVTHAAPAKPARHGAVSR